MKKSLSIGVVFLMIISSLICEESLLNENNVRTLTVDDAVILAADNNLTLKRNRLSLELLEKQKNSSIGSSVTPGLNLSGTYSKPFEENQYGSKDSTFSLSASASLALTPSLYTTIKSAKLNYESGITSYENAVREIELSVRKTFYSLLYSKENIALQQRNIETARQSYQLNLDKYNRGQLSEIDLLTSQMNYESLLPTLESAQNSYENSIASFKQILGISQNQQIELSGTLTEFANLQLEESEFKYDIEEVPSVKTIKESITKAENSLLATRFSAWGPTVTASYSYGKSKTGTDGSEWSTTGNSLSIGVQIPLDGYLPWTQGALSVESQKVNLEDLKLQLENEKISVDLNVQNSLKTIKQALSQLKTLQNNVELAQKTYEMTLTAYNLGSRDLLTLQTSADSLMSARINLQSQTYTLLSTILDLENTLGIPFGTLMAQKDPDLQENSQ